MESTIWKLESPDQDVASEDLNRIIDYTLDVKNSFGARMQNIKYLIKLWDGEKWHSIKEKLMTEGSGWYVWYMDGVNQHLNNITE